MFCVGFLDTLVNFKSVFDSRQSSGVDSNREGSVYRSCNKSHTPCPLWAFNLRTFGAWSAYLEIYFCSNHHALFQFLSQIHRQTVRKTPRHRRAMRRQMRAHPGIRRHLRRWEPHNRLFEGCGGSFARMFVAAPHDPASMRWVKTDRVFVRFYRSRWVKT